MKRATMMKATLIFLSLGFVWGCLYRTPRIENAYYKNFEYEFKIKIPHEWQSHKNITDEIKDGTAAPFAEDFILMLSNPKTNGIILVTATKSDEDIIALNANKEAFQNRLLALLTEREEMLTAEYGYEGYTYELGSLEIAEGYGPTLTYFENAKNQNGDMFVRAVYLNKCQKDETCTLAFTLLCKEADYNLNAKALTKVTDTAMKVYQE